MSYSKLRGRIREVYGSERKFAEAMEMSAVAMSNRLNDKASWTIDEVKKAAELLAIEDQRVPSYFFNR